VSPGWNSSLVDANPGIFFDAGSGFGAVLIANTNKTTDQRPAATGDWISVYCTGLGETKRGSSGLDETKVLPEVRIGGQRAEVKYSGLAPGYPGLYQINVIVPANAGTGVQVLSVAVEGVASNEVKVMLR
jgi:uncharacterized protein (TIGR03437 family)